MNYFEINAVCLLFFILNEFVRTANFFISQFLLIFFFHHPPAVMLKAHFRAKPLDNGADMSYNSTIRKRQLLRIVE